MKCIFKNQNIWKPQGVSRVCITRQKEYTCIPECSCFRVKSIQVFGVFLDIFDDVN